MSSNTARWRASMLSSCEFCSSITFRMPVPRKGLRRCDCWGRLREHANQTRAILFGKETGELHNARRFASVVGEDQNFAEFGLASGPGDRFSEVGRSALGHEFCSCGHKNLRVNSHLTLSRYLTLSR